MSLDIRAVGAVLLPTGRGRIGAEFSSSAPPESGTERGGV